MAKKKVRVDRFVDNKATTKVTLVFEEDGDSQSDEFKLRYSAVSPKRQRAIDEWAEGFNAEQGRRDEERAEELKQAREAKADEATLAEIERRHDDAERYALAEFLVMMGVELPEIVDDAEHPVEITADLLATFETKNLLAIREAIRKDANPNATPSAA